MKRLLLPFFGDLIVIAVFVLLGRSEHDSGSSVTGYVNTLAPFALGLVIAWTIVIATQRRPTRVPTGIIVWLVTVVAGIALRRVVFGDGIAIAFIIVATAFTALGFIGWRAIAQRIPS